MSFIDFACIQDFMMHLEDKEGHLNDVQDNEK